MTNYRALLDSARAEIARRRHDISIEKVAEQQEQAAILSRNEQSALEIEHDRRQLAEIDAALERLREGSFGVCEECGGAIKIKRLDAVPWAKYCVTCQEAAELAACSICGERPCSNPSACAADAAYEARD